MEVETCGLEETILEVIEIEEYVGAVHLGLWIAVREIQTSGTTYLKIGELCDSPAKKFALSLCISTTGLTSILQCIEEAHVTKIGLQIAKTILTLDEYLRDRQLSKGKMSGEIAESMVLVTTRTNNPDDTMTVCIRKSEILTIATTACDRLTEQRIVTGIGFV